MNWKGSPEYTNYEVQISDDKSFNNILENQKVTKNFHVPSKYLKRTLIIGESEGLPKTERTQIIPHLSLKLKSLRVSNLFSQRITKSLRLDNQIK